MSQIVHGKAQGRTIILDEPLELELGQEVEVIVRPVVRSRPWGEGIRISAGAMAQTWTEADDVILAEIQADRNRSLRPEIQE